MVHAIKAIHDICKCGMVICSTNIGRTEVERGHDAKLCSQLLKRGTIQLQLRNSSYNPEADLGAFVRELAERCKIYDGSTIRTTSNEDTFADLINNGFLTERK